MRRTFRASQNKWLKNFSNDFSVVWRCRFAFQFNSDHKRHKKKIYFSHRRRWTFHVSFPLQTNNFCFCRCNLKLSTFSFISFRVGRACGWYLPVGNGKRKRCRNETFLFVSLVDSNVFFLPVFHRVRLHIDILVAFLVRNNEWKRLLFQTLLKIFLHTIFTLSTSPRHNCRRWQRRWQTENENRASGEAEKNCARKILVENVKTESHAISVRK